MNTIFDDIVYSFEMAKQSHESGQRDYWLEHFAALVEAHEREACAKLCESYLSESPHSWGGTTIAAAIRARGTT